MKYPHLHPYKLTDALIVLGSFFMSIVLAILIIFVQSIFHLKQFSSNTFNIALELFIAGLVFVSTYFFIIKKNHLTISDFGFNLIPLGKLIGYVALGFLITFAGWIVIAPFIIVFFPGVDLGQSQNIFQKDMTVTAQVLLIFYAIVVGPLVEEVIFRGVLLPCLTNKVNIYFGVIISTLIWSLLHFQTNVIIFTFIFGIILSYLYITSKSLWPSYLTHVVKNSMAVIAIYALGLFK